MTSALRPLTNLGFRGLIDRLEAEIATEYVGGAIRWIDERHHGAWSAAINRFDLALARAISSENFDLAMREGEIYRESLLAFLGEYKRCRKVDETKSFLSSLKSTRALREPLQMEFV